MKLKDYLKKRIMFFGLTILIIVISVGTVSFALNQNNMEKYIDKNEHINVEYLSGNKELQVSPYAISNEVGSIYAPENKIRIINVSETPVNYEIKITPSKNNELKDLSALYISVNGGDIVSLGSLEYGIVKTHFIEGLTEDIIDIRIWTSKEHFKEEYSGKTIALNLSIIEK